jgi:hypothetical protein
MARNETVINVFVASPGDVNEERSALEAIITELNRTWSKNLNLRLDLVKWETNIHPNFGSYPQDVINQQLNDEYDVFIALFWSKVGTPTNIADSGTIEEFERAYKKYKNDPNSVDIMVYFKDQAISPSQMNLEQLQKIQSLKEKMGEKGGLYWMFDNTEDFENLLRGHLSRVAQSWSKKLQITEKVEQVNHHQLSDNIIDESDDYGLFDYIDIYEDRISDITSALELMSDATVKIGTQFSRRTAEISKFNSANSNNPKEARKIIKLTSDDLTRYSEIINSQVSILSPSRIEAFDALSKGISISIELSKDEDELKELKESLFEMLKSTGNTESSLLCFRKSVVNLPRLNLQINKAKRQVTLSLDRVLDETRKMMQSANDVLETIQNIEDEKYNKAI